jgi:hypothetical protein
MMRRRNVGSRVASAVLDGAAPKMRSRETSIVRGIQEALRYDRRVLVWRQNTGGAHLPGSGPRGKQFVRFGIPGQADLTGLVASTGRRLEIECKRPGEEQTDLQRHFESEIKRAGGVYLLVHSVGECRAKLDEVIAQENLRYLDSADRSAMMRLIRHRVEDIRLEDGFESRVHLVGGISTEALLAWLLQRYDAAATAFDAERVHEVRYDFE